jgi:hypothetical protein
MITSYNRIAGQSVERLAALSDGIFGVAMTPLAIDLRVPARELMHHERDRQASSPSRRTFVYLLSFLTLGIFWVGQQSQLKSPAPFRHPPHLDSLGVLVCRHSHCHFPPSFSERTTPTTPPYSSTGATGSSLAPCFTPAGVTPPAPASSRTTSLPNCPLLSVAALSSVSLGMPSGAVLCVFSTCLSVLTIIFVQWFYILSPWLRLPHTENASTPRPIRSVVTESLFL